MQVTIEEADHARAKSRAAKAGVSLAEYVRRLVKRDLADQPVTHGPAMEELFGIGDSGGSDIASGKSAAIGEAVAAAKSR